MKIENWHRRQALMLASQLPESPADALAVIECVRELIVTFLQSAEAPEPVKATATIVTLVRDCPDLSA
jgi:hypothetical protein